LGHFLCISSMTLSSCFIWARKITNFSHKYWHAYLEKLLSNTNNNSFTVMNFWILDEAKSIWKELDSVWPQLTEVQIPLLKGQPSFLLTRPDLIPLKGNTLHTFFISSEVQRNGSLWTMTVSFHRTTVYIQLYVFILKCIFKSSKYSWKYENKQKVDYALIDFKASDINSFTQNLHKIYKYV
jgi:hypothetical protein